VTGLQADSWSFVPSRDSEGVFFPLCHHMQTSFGVYQALIQWVPEALSPRLKQLGLEADQLS